MHSSEAKNHEEFPSQSPEHPQEPTVSASSSASPEGCEKSWVGFSNLAEHLSDDVRERISAIINLSEHKTGALSSQFQTLSKNAGLQAQYLNELISIAQNVQVGDRTVSIQEVSGMLHKTFLESITCMLEISKQAMLMVYILNDGVRNLNKIEKSIRQIEIINHKTKYLSINATIEAVRAGEAGESFQVVASEVRDLSNDTQKLAVNIREEVNQMTQTLNYAQDLLQKVASIDMSDNILAKEQLDEMMNGLIENSEKISHIVGDASQASREFADSARKLITDIQYQDRVRQDLEHIQRTVSSMQTLNEGIRSLQETVNPIIVDIEALKSELPGELQEPIDAIMNKKPPFSSGMDAESSVSSDDIELF